MTDQILPTLLTAQQVADELGYPLHRIYELSRRGDMPCVRFGRTMRFDPAALKAWLAAGGTAASDGDDQAA